MSNVREPPEVAVVLASANRPALLQNVLANLREQTWSPFILVVSVPDEKSLPSAGLPNDAILVQGRGLAAQRNAALAAIPSATHVFCFDDDAVIRNDYIENAIAFFDTNPSVVALTGMVIADGAQRDEISELAAEEMLARSALDSPDSYWERTRELYGCNFAFLPHRVNHERFDSRLPLYSWLEDHDFARRAMRYGDLARVNSCVIVHRGVKSGGREAHRRLGYSQVMNPFYLWRKGSFPLWLAADETVFRVAKNIACSLIGPHRSSRRLRLRGNVRAGVHILRGRVTPEYATQIGD